MKKPQAAKTKHSPGHREGYLLPWNQTKLCLYGLCLLLVLGLSSTSLKAQGSKGHSTLPLGPISFAVVETSARPTPEQWDFHPVSQIKGYLGESPKTYWFQFQLPPGPTKDLEAVFVVERLEASRLEFWRQIGGQWRLFRAKDYQRGSRFHSQPSHRPNFKLKLSGKPEMVLLKATTPGARIVSFQLKPEPDFLQEATLDHVVYAFCVGLLYIMVLYNLNLFISFKSQQYLYFSGYIFFCTTYFVARDGYIASWVGVNYPNLGLVLSVNLAFLYLGLSFRIIYCFQFLESYRHKGMWLLLLLIDLPAGVLIFRHSWLKYVDNQHILIAEVFLLLFLLRRSWVGQSQTNARWLLASYGISMLGGLFEILQRWGVLGPSFRFTVAGCTVVEVVILSFYMSTRIHQVRRGLLTAKEDLLEQEQSFSQSLQVSIVEKERALQEVETLNEKLQQTNKRLIEVDRIKDDFLAKTSHEFRTPLQGITGVAQALQQGKNGPVSPEVNESLGVIVYSAKRLCGLVNDILDLNQINNNQVELNPVAVDVRVMVQLLVENCQPLLKNPQVSLVNQVSSELPWVQADETRLLQILYNLVGNSIKFTDHGQITVSASSEADFVRITVKDTGLGFNLSQVEQLGLGALPSQANPSARGFGLGLEITKELVALHGGEFEIQSIPGQGAAVSFSMPRSASERTHSSSAPVAFGSQNGGVEYPKVQDQEGGLQKSKDPRVLMIDDEPVILETLQLMLKGRGLDLHCCGDSTEAVQAVESLKPDLVILDLMMPGIGGQEVLGQLRKTHSRQDLPVLILTATHRREDLQARLAHANDFLFKPVEPEELLAKVDGLLEYAQLARFRSEQESATAGKERQFREDMVHLLCEALAAWSAQTQGSKIDFAEQSGLWSVQLDGATFKTRTLDKYLKHDALPKKPRWAPVYHSVEWILKQLPPGDQSQGLRDKLQALVQKGS